MRSARTPVPLILALARSWRWIFIGSALGIFAGAMTVWTRPPSVSAHFSVYLARMANKAVVTADEVSIGWAGIVRQHECRGIFTKRAQQLLLEATVRCPTSGSLDSAVAAMVKSAVDDVLPEVKKLQMSLDASIARVRMQAENASDPIVALIAEQQLVDMRLKRMISPLRAPTIVQPPSPHVRHRSSGIGFWVLGGVLGAIVGSLGACFSILRRHEGIGQPA